MSGGPQASILWRSRIDICILIDILVQVKPKLSETRRSAWPSLVPELNKIAALAESIMQQRPRSSKEWLLVADILDREGACLLFFNEKTAAALLKQLQGSISGMHLALSEMKTTTPVEK